MWPPPDQTELDGMTMTTTPTITTNHPPIPLTRSTKPNNNETKNDTKR